MEDLLSKSELIARRSAVLKRLVNSGYRSYVRPLTVDVLNFRIHSEKRDAELSVCVSLYRDAPESFECAYIAGNVKVGGMFEVETTADLVNEIKRFIG